MNRIATLAGSCSLLSYLLLWFIPNATIDNFPLVELLGTILFLIFAGSSVFALILLCAKWKKLKWIERMFLPAGSIIWLAVYFTFKIGTPIVDLEIKYVGVKDEIMVDISFGYGAVGNHILKRNETWDLNMGSATDYLVVEWGESYKNDYERRFDLTGEIPRIGKDRLIIVTIDDDITTYTIETQQSNQSGDDNSE